MKKWILLFFLPCLSFAADFDVLVVGTSPLCLLEALYYHYLGQRVVVLEEAGVCGGAWRTIDICGIENVDLGCHLLYGDERMRQFFQEYLGCEIVSMDDPHAAYDAEKNSNGYYFSRGCHEMMTQLLQWVDSTEIVLILGCRLESLYFDQIAYASTKEQNFTALKVIAPTYCDIKIKNVSKNPEQPKSKTKFFHIYMLIEDDSIQKFTYMNGKAEGVSRTMNLTFFTGLEGTGKQLIIFQTYNENYLNKAESYFERLKSDRSISPKAQFIRAETHIYEQSPYNGSCEHFKTQSDLFEHLNTTIFSNLSNHIPKWIEVFPTFKNRCSSAH